MPRALVVLFAIITVPYGAAWMYYYQIQTASGSLGFASEYEESERAIVVGTVENGGAAAQSGLRPGDRIIAVDGTPLATSSDFNVWERTPVEHDVALGIVRDGTTVRLTAHRPTVSPFSLRGLFEHSLSLLAIYPAAFLTVALTVLALRPTDRHAWLMAGLFASFISIPQFPWRYGILPPLLSGFVAAYRTIGLAAFPVFFYGFFAVFPTRSPLDLAAPWLKWANILGCVIFALPNLDKGTPAEAPLFLQHLLGASLADGARLAYLFAGTPLGLLSLGWNAVSATSSDARRKARVLLWGTVLGVSPVFLEPAAISLGGWQTSAGVHALSVLLSFVFPLSFAYAVIRHRVLDIPVLLRRSARYLLVRRGSFVLIAVLGTTLAGVFATSFSRLFAVSGNVAILVGSVFGLMLTLGSSRIVRQATTRIDRAFFRGAYDATAILESLAHTIPTVTSPPELALLLEREISQALHPNAAIVYLEGQDGRLYPQATRWIQPPPVLRPDRPWIDEVARRGRPWDPAIASDEGQPAFLREFPAECLVPIVGRKERLLGLVVLSARASEETYSRDDKRLLQSVASQAAIALENIRLAEEIAERLDADRLAARELDIARQVQARLFPQRQPNLETLDYAGGCVQARLVGGDYYDFVELGAGHLGLVVADISGKGIAGALLMANLQANLRGQYAMAANDLPKLLKSVNQLFFDNTAENQYATLFFADYSDETRRLSYANCGHFPPFLVHADGTYEKLLSTATVLGLFEHWEGATDERELKPGDTLVIYTDGVVEANNPEGEEFGDEQLLAVIREHRQAPAASLVGALQEAVQTFSHGVLSDDVTVVVARVR